MSSPSLDSSLSPLTSSPTPSDASVHHVLPDSLQTAQPVADLAAVTAPNVAAQLEGLRDIWQRDRTLGVEIFDGYFNNMLKHFPPEEMAGRNEFIAALDSGTYDIQMLKVGGKVVGGMHQWEIEVPGNGMVIAIPFVWVDPEARGQGYGTTLATMGREIVKQSGAWAQIAEVNDSHLMTSAEKIADGGEAIPGRREEFWKRLGWEKLDMAYIQPNLDLENPASKPVTYVSLLIDVLGTPQQTDAIQRGPGGSTMSRELSIAIMQAYIDNISSYDGGAVNDPSFHVIANDARKGPERIRLIDPTQPRQNLHSDFREYRQAHQTV